MARVSNKREMFELFEAGKFGNRLRVFKTLEELRASGYEGKMGLRHLEPSKLAGARTEYNIPYGRIETHYQAWIDDGLQPDRIRLCEMAPHEFGTIQGEAQQSIRTLELHYNTLQIPMKTAFERQSLHAHGIVAVRLLRDHLDPDSFDNLMRLFDEYPDCVVEFSTFSIDLGDLPRRNTVFWEVRHY